MVKASAEVKVGWRTVLEEAEAMAWVYLAAAFEAKDVVDQAEAVEGDDLVTAAVAC